MVTKQTRREFLATAAAGAAALGLACAGSRPTISETPTPVSGPTIPSNVMGNDPESTRIRDVSKAPAEDLEVAGIRKIADINYDQRIRRRLKENLETRMFPFLSADVDIRNFSFPLDIDFGHYRGGRPKCTNSGVYFNKLRIEDADDSWIEMQTMSVPAVDYSQGFPGFKYNKICYTGGLLNMPVALFRTDLEGGNLKSAINRKPFPRGLLGLGPLPRSIRNGYVNFSISSDDRYIAWEEPDNDAICFMDISQKTHKIQRMKPIEEPMSFVYTSPVWFRDKTFLVMKRKKYLPEECSELVLLDFLNKTKTPLPGFSIKPMEFDLKDLNIILKYQLPDSTGVKKPHEIMIPNAGTLETTTYRSIKYLDLVGGEEDAVILMGVKENYSAERNSTGNDQKITSHIFGASRGNRYNQKPTNQKLISRIIEADERDGYRQKSIIQSEEHYLVSPVWSRSSEAAHTRKIAFNYGIKGPFDEERRYGSEDPEREGLWVANDDGSGLSELVPKTDIGYKNPAWASNGRIFCEGNDWGIYMITLKTKSR
jgi:hypothetical protein